MQPKEASQTFAEILTDSAKLIGWTITWVTVALFAATLGTILIPPAG